MHNKAPQNSAARKILSNPARQAFAQAQPNRATPQADCGKDKPAARKTANCGKTAPFDGSPDGRSVQRGNASAAHETVDVLILGAGAAGLMCAREAAANGMRVVLLERGPAPGRKLAVSGGGKANFTTSRWPRVITAATAAGATRFAPRPSRPLRQSICCAWCRRGTCLLKSVRTGSFFLTVAAQRLVRALVDDCRNHGCHIVCGSAVTGVQTMPDGFAVQTEGGQWRGKALVLALGSPAWPQAGGSGAGYRLAADLGHSVIPPRPVLTPLRLKRRLPPAGPYRHKSAGTLRTGRAAMAGRPAFYP